MADNFKAWVASVVTREGSISVTEKHSMVGGGGGGGGQNQVYRSLFHKMTNPQKEEALKG